MRSSQTAEALPTQAGPQTTHPVPRPLFLQLGKLRTASRSQITKPAGGGSCRSPLASCFLQRALSPAPPAPRYPSLISTAQTRWAASVQPGRMHWRHYVNYEALRKLTSRWRRKTPPRADRPPPCLPGAPFFRSSPDPGAAEARRSSRSALRPPGPRERPQPILTRADQRHGALAALRGSSHWAPGSATGPPRDTSSSLAASRRSAASGELPRGAMLANGFTWDCGQSRASASRI